LGTTWSFPVNYEIHNFTDTDEVYFIVNYNSGFYQQLSFGKSDVSGIGGTGAWFTGTYSTQVSSATSTTLLAISVSATQLNAQATMSVGLFADLIVSIPSSFVHSGLDATEWKFWKNTTADTSSTHGVSYAAGLLTSLPNLTNQSSVLVPIKCVQARSGSNKTIIANLKNARFLRIDYINAGDIITFGAEQWKVYPWYKKDASVRNGSSGGQGVAHSGTFGYAIKYTGV
jgi:hypothetical protein